MPAKRLSMRKIKDVLRLRAQGLSDRKVARSVKVARTTVRGIRRGTEPPPDPPGAYLFWVHFGYFIGGDSRSGLRPNVVPKSGAMHQRPSIPPKSLHGIGSRRTKGHPRADSRRSKAEYTVGTDTSLPAWSRSTRRMFMPYAVSHSNERRAKRTSCSNAAK